MALRQELKRLREDMIHHTTVLDQLQSVPNERALEIIDQLRAGLSVADLAQHITQSPSHYSLSETRTACGILPGVQSTRELELMVRHKIAYPSSFPTITTGLCDRQDPGRPSITKGLEPSGTNSEPKQLPTEQLSGRQSPPIAKATSIGGPMQPPQHCDARLQHLEISYWTQVPIGNELAAQAISAYLENEHALVGFFDADLFIADLVNHRQEHCSSFLASSLLSLTCVSSPASHFQNKCLTCNSNAMQAMICTRLNLLLILSPKRSCCGEWTDQPLQPLL